MIKGGYREEVLNVLLAQLLNERGVISTPETIQQWHDKSRVMPDIIVSFQGLRTVIEGKVEDQPSAEECVIQDIQRRVEQGIAHIGIAILYPPELRNIPFPELKSSIADIDLRIQIQTEAGTEGWIRCNIDQLSDILRRVFEQLIEEDTISKAVAAIEAGVERFAFATSLHKGFPLRSAKILGITKPESPEALLAVCRVAGLTIFNAMVFQEELAINNNDLKNLESVLSEKYPIPTFITHWKYILDEINYVPIFKVARELLLAIAIHPEIDKGLMFLGKRAQDIMRWRALFRHDLMGRVYHQLLVDSKYLGAYFTSVPAATLLLKLSLQNKDWHIDWSDTDAVSSFLVGDFACGTGTLLMAAAEALTDNYIHACSAKSIEPRINQLHRVLMEQTIYGFDVLPSALHLTASTLSLRSSSVEFRDTNLYCLPFGGKDIRLGSIEFLMGRQISMPMDIFGSEERQVTGEGDVDTAAAPLPSLDICVMNPPFTRSVGGNLLFGSIPDPERREMQDKLQNLIRKGKLKANVTAGLGSVFVVIGDHALKVGGRLALVLPKAFLSGVAWQKTRQLLKERYHVEYIIASHDPGRWNFSDNTNLSEVMIIAKKETANRNANSKNDRKTININLWKNPESTFEAMSIVHSILDREIPDIESGQGALQINTGSAIVGEVLSTSWKDIPEDNWILPSSFAQADLIRTSSFLQRGELSIPGSVEIHKIPMCPLSFFGELGSDRRDIHDGFSMSKVPTIYSAFWNHNAKSVFCLSQTPNSYLSPLTSGKPGRSLRKVHDLWPKAADVLIVEKLWLNTQKLCAVKLSEKVISNTWWAFSFHKDNDLLKKVIVLWLNSTLGFLVLVSKRVETRGAWMQFKKPSLLSMPVLDLEKLDNSQIKMLSSVYDKIENEELKPFPFISSDEVRIEIDQAICNALKLPSLANLRKLLSQEPILTLVPLGG